MDFLGQYVFSEKTAHLCLKLDLELGMNETRRPYISRDILHMKINNQLILYGFYKIGDNFIILENQKV